MDGSEHATDLLSGRLLPQLLLVELINLLLLHLHHVDQGVVRLVEHLQIGHWLDLDLLVPIWCYLQVLGRLANRNSS